MQLEILPSDCFHADLLHVGEFSNKAKKSCQDEVYIRGGHGPLLQASTCELLKFICDWEEGGLTSQNKFYFTIYFI